MNKKDVIGVTPFNLGWLEYRLNSQEMEYLWRCIKKKQDDYRSSLAGNISGSYKLMDRGDWFFYNTLRPLFLQYQDQFCNLGKDVPVPPALLYPYYLVDWWVNIQKQNDFNPMHRHGGVYSFVIWMKIPTEWKKQNLGNKTNCPRISSFEIVFSNILGEIQTHSYHLTPKHEGLMLFFPSQLNHSVYPFYNCDEDRISVSGNLSLNTTKVRHV